MELKILDCTLRDGGYYTSWDFDQDLVNDYLEAFENLPVDYLEIGYRSQPLGGYLGKYFYCPLPVIEDIRKRTGKKLAIILNEKDVRAEDAEALLRPIVGMVEMVRMAVDPANFARALQLAEKVKKLGFEVALNVMYMSTWANQREFLDSLGELEGVADYLYMVDSFGGVFPKDVQEIIQLIRSKVDIKLGFHGHNNLEMALANTLTAINEGVDIVDATITGMGRGAGNLKTELLLTVLNSQGKLDVSFNDLSKVVDGFSELQRQHEWGPNLPYMVSGANSLPQKQVMEWVSKRYYSYNSIIRALTNQSKGIYDNERLPEIEFEGESKHEDVLIVGGGESVKSHFGAIYRFLDQNPEIAVIHASSRNALAFSDIENNQYFCLVGNEGHRLEQVFGDASRARGKCILPPYPRKMGTYVPSKVKSRAFELKEISFTDKLKNTHTAIALETAIELGGKNFYFVGYDGYAGATMGRKEQEFFAENEFLFSKVTALGYTCKSLTLTNYDNLEQESIYAYIP